MKPVVKWILGILVAVVLIGVFSATLIARIFLPGRGYGMMGYGWQAPMMYGGYSMMGFGVVFSGLIQLGLLVLIILGIIWLWGAIKRRDQKGN
jgi:hypothetical protein